MVPRIIVSNGEFFLEKTFNEVVVITDSNGYYNASKLCRDHRCSYKRWRYDKRTEMILQRSSELLFKDIENDDIQLTSPEVPLIVFRNDLYPRETRGHYVHPRLIHYLCDWCDVNYMIYNEMIMNYVNEELQLQRIDLEQKLKDMDYNLKKYRIREESFKRDQTKVNDKNKVNVNIIRIYDVSKYLKDEEFLDAFDEDCIWQIELNSKKRKKKYRLLLEVEVQSTVKINIQSRKYFNINEINGKTHTIKQSLKQSLYNRILNKIERKKIVHDEIGV